MQTEMVSTGIRGDHAKLTWTRFLTRKSRKPTSRGFDFDIAMTEGPKDNETGTDMN